MLAGRGFGKSAKGGTAGVFVFWRDFFFFLKKKTTTTTHIQREDITKTAVRRMR
jgi:hypothetical protein